MLLPLVLSLGLFAHGEPDVVYAEELLATRQGEQALTAIEALQRRAPSSKLDLLRVEALLVMGRVEQARFSLADLRGRYPQEIEVHLQRAGLYARLGDVGSSIAVLQRLQERWPDDPVVAERIGDRYTQFGADAYLQALLAQPDQHSARLKLAGLAATQRLGNGGGNRVLLPAGAELRAAEAEIGAALKAWADAWSVQDVATYAGAYLPPVPVELEQPDGSRRLVSQVAIEFTTPRRAEVYFVEADKQRGTERRRYKRIQLVRAADRQWKLTNERILAP